MHIRTDFILLSMVTDYIKKLIRNYVQLEATKQYNRMIILIRSSKFDK